MKIVIMRHGDAQLHADSDQSRQLTSYGRLEAGKAGQCLVDLAMSFDEVWVSPYIRAQQTADEVGALFSHFPRHIVDTVTPGNSPADILDLLSSCRAECLLIISHNPFVSLLVEWLVGSSSIGEVCMGTASVACIDIDDVLPGCGQLQWVRHKPNFEKAF